jgi:hypothetical protein
MNESISIPPLKKHKTNRIGIPQDSSEVMIPFTTVELRIALTSVVRSGIINDFDWI